MFAHHIQLLEATTETHTTHSPLGSESSLCVPHQQYLRWNHVILVEHAALCWFLNQLQHQLRGLA